MKKYINNLLLLAVGVLFVFSCRPDQDVEDIIDATEKPRATITRVDDLTEVTEGDVLVFEVKMDKMMRESVDFDHEIADGNESVLHLDYDVEPGTVSEYSTTATIEVHVHDDGVPENTKKLAINVGAFDLAQNFQLSPESDVFEVNVDVKNAQRDDALMIGFEWVDPEHVIDFDMLVEHADLGSWSAGATSDNPETAVFDFDTDDPSLYDGEIYVGVDPYDVPDGQTPYVISVGHPDGTVEIFEGIFDTSKTSEYQVDNFSAWALPFYRVLHVTKSGSGFVVKHELPQP